jgi:uncharacterized protein YbjT (DUF2867 family)
MTRPRILILGATGVTGGAVATLLDGDARVEVVRAARRPEQVASWQAEGKAAVLIDLDDPRSFPAALATIDRLFVVTAYTIEMVHQVKCITDAAADAGVGFIVHLGVFSNGRETDPHFAWHELVERYIEGSGVAWCHLHPNMFMENLLTTQRLAGDTFLWPMADKRTGWIAGDDLTAVAAKVLAEGPAVHAGANHYLSSELLGGPDIAAILARVLDRPIVAAVSTPDQLAAAFASGTARLPANIEPHYGASILENVRQIVDGRMAHVSAVTDTVETLLGRPPVRLAEWVDRHREELTRRPRAG